MKLLDVLMAAQGGGAVTQLGQQFGLGNDQTSAALSALVPALAAGLARNATREGGLEGLTAALAGGQHAGYLDDAASLARPGTVADGNGILGHILGSKDASRAVAAGAAQQTGLDASLFKKALPLVASLVMGAMAKQTSGGAATMATATGSGGGLLSMLTPLLDQNRDGSVVDDVMGMLGKLGGS